MSQSFRALRVHQVPSGSEARIERLTLNDLTDGDVVIRTRWAGINYKDSLAVSGKAKVLSGSVRIPGIELVGVVETSDSPHSRWAATSSCMASGPASTSTAASQSGCGHLPRT